MNLPPDLPFLPGQIEFKGGQHVHGSGASLRQVYAGLILPAVVASTPDFEGDKENVVRLSVELADALLVELSKPRSE